MREFETSATAGLGRKRLVRKAGILMCEMLGASCRAYSAIHAAPQELPGGVAPRAA